MALFERFQRSEKALVSALAEMYVQGVSRRKVKAITEELCGHRFSASTISAINKGLDESLTKVARRRLPEAYPLLFLDGRYEKVRGDGIIQRQAVLLAIVINWEGQRQVLGVEPANRESATSWREFLLALQQRGLSGVEFVVSDDHAGLRKAIAEILPAAAWRRCYVHFLRNALDYLPRKADNDCLQELRRRTRVARIFPNAASCLRLVRALCVETHEAWLEDRRYLSMAFFWEQRKEQLRKAA